MKAEFPQTVRCIPHAFLPEKGAPMDAVDGIITLLLLAAALAAGTGLYKGSTPSC